MLPVELLGRLSRRPPSHCFYISTPEPVVVDEFLFLLSDLFPLIMVSHL